MHAKNLKRDRHAVETARVAHLDEALLDTLNTGSAQRGALVR